MSWGKAPSRMCKMPIFRSFCAYAHSHENLYPPCLHSTVSTGHLVDREVRIRLREYAGRSMTYPFRFAGLDRWHHRMTGKVSQKATLILCMCSAKAHNTRESVIFDFRDFSPLDSRTFSVILTDSGGPVSLGCRCSSLCWCPIFLYRPLSLMHSLCKSWDKCYFEDIQQNIM